MSAIGHSPDIHACRALLNERYDSPIVASSLQSSSVTLPYKHRNVLWPAPNLAWSKHVMPISIAATYFLPGFLPALLSQPDARLPVHRQLRFRGLVNSVFEHDDSRWPPRAHMSMCVRADKYSIPTLSDYAADRFNCALDTLVPLRNFPECVRMVYEGTPNTCPVRTKITATFVRRSGGMVGVSELKEELLDQLVG